MSQILDKLLEATFADASPEGGGYAAAPLPLAPWVRLVKGALGGQLTSNGWLGLQFSKRLGARLTVQGVMSTLQFNEFCWSICDGMILPGFSRATLAPDGVIASDLTSSPLKAVGKWGPIHEMLRATLAALGSANGYSTNGYTLRATSPTDITLSLSGDTVTAEFNPPLQATAPVLLGLVKATRPIPRIRATERQLTIEIDGYSDQVIPLCEPQN